MSVTGTWDDVFGDAAPAVARTALILRKVILSLDPAMAEVARPGYRAVTFGRPSTRMSDACCYLMAQRDRVNLGFYHGASLPDPGGLLEGTGGALRHVKIVTDDLARSDGVAALIAAAMTLIPSTRKPGGAA